MSETERDRDPTRHRPARTAPRASSLDHAAWLSAEVVIVVGKGDPPTAYGFDTSAELSLSDCRYLRLKARDLSGDSGFIATGLAKPARAGSARHNRAGSAWQVTDQRTLVREGLAPLDAPARARVLEFLAATQTSHAEIRDVLGLAKSLRRVRDALRERLPKCVVARDSLVGLHIDSLLAIDERCFLAQGWIRERSAPVTRLTAVSPEGARAEVLPAVFRYPRPDVDAFYGGGPVDGNQKSGFVAYIELEDRFSSRLTAGWVIEMTDQTGQGAEAEAPEAISDAVAVRGAVLSILVAHSQLENGLMRHFSAATTRVQERLARSTDIAEVAEFGAPPERPSVSLIIPLFRRIDFLEHQLSQFVHDAEVRAAELIYVLDSPELKDELFAVAEQLFDLYRVPFRVAVLSRNAGFAVATNLGASLAAGRLLLLLNSDVLPATPGWLARLAEFYERQTCIGALGPKLLFEDDSLQHAGLYWRRRPGSEVWENAHYYKGLHRSLPAANVVRRVPAVTAACLMVQRDLYRGLGGLRNRYVQGDYEDSDFCLRLLSEGYENWYMPETELYHLEAQSYPSQDRRMNWRYNSWLQTDTWGDVIARLMEDTPDGAANGAARGGAGTSARPRTASRMPQSPEPTQQRRP